MTAAIAPILKCYIYLLLSYLIPLIIVAGDVTAA